MNQSTKAMIIASRLIYKGYNRAEAMKKAWTLLKQPLETKISGVTYENRQNAIRHLTRYPRELIRTTLERDKGNLYDSNAIAVVVTVVGRGSMQMGHLPKPLCGVLAPILDAGEQVKSTLKDIVGGFSNLNYGSVIAVSI